MSTNPFFESWNTPFAAPPFSQIQPEHFRPAYDRAFAEHARQIAAIAESSEAPSFENTIAAIEKSGRMLARIDLVFGNLAASDTNDALQAIERDMAPLHARHWNAVFLNADLFRRIDTLFSRRETLGLDAESLRVLERYHLDFVRAGAKLDGEERKRYARIGERLAELGTAFGQNVLADEQEFVLPLKESDLDGLPDFAREAAAGLAGERGTDAPYAITTSRSSAEPFLQFSRRRDLREKVFKALTARGDNGNAHDNKNTIAEIVKLRAERAKLLGYSTFADYRLADSMAETPDNARILLDQVWTAARSRALEERDALQAMVAEEGSNFALAAWDWRYYAEKLRKERYDFDEAEVIPYLQLDKMIEAAFDTARRLFGLDFRERKDIPVYHPDVRVWEVSRNGEHVGLFFGDYFARPSKRGGAWMSSFRDQENIEGRVTPIIVNTCNFPKASPALLNFDEAKTLFHEFGHALHGLLSNVRFPRLAGTNVARDFVELPSQIFEHWLEEPAVLEKFAIHVETGKPMPKALLEKLNAAHNFNQGFATVEFLGSAFADLDFHALENPGDVDVSAFEKQSMARIGMPDEIAMRHRPAHFLHIFDGDGYSAGYYSYMWAEVLDADGFRAFKEAKDPFDPEIAKRLHDYIYSAGGTRDYAEAYRLFRGHDPKIDALLEGRGLKAA
ncbi:MAG: M3 family metallopeptidase [Proteobacteria bacterium]|nr:M3 family metallopeptidase [Pseudomonadota bacterium]